MENSKGPSTIKNLYNGKHYSLPPKSPFPTIAPFYPDYTPNTISRSKGIISKYRDKIGLSLHQRTSSESHAIEEQPSWLNELLDEPETPVKKGHRRSSSDSFTYIENIELATQIEYRSKNMNSASSWRSQDFDRYKDSRNMLFYAEQNPNVKNNNRVWDSPQYVLNVSQEVNRIISTTNEKLESGESCSQDSHVSSERNDSSNFKDFTLETDTTRSKQQFAQRSRVRKLQYIAELERNVQALQVEGCEVSGEIKFLNQRSLILTMENKALKQRLENLAQEQLIKYLEHEVLEREIGRLRALYKQQQQPPTEKPVLSHRLTATMESHFANLSLKNKESGALRDAVSGI